MKIKLLYLAFLLFPLHLWAQKNLIKDSMPVIIVPENYNTEEFRNKLVEEANKNVSVTREALNEAEIAKYQLSASKIQWLNYVSITGNLNEFTLSPTKYENQATFYPRYNFSLSIPLGSFFTNAYNTKIARYNLSIAKDRQKFSAIQLRSDVLSKFEEYIQARELLKFQSVVLNDEETVHVLSEKKFKSNQISLEEFNNSSKSLFLEKSKIIELQKNYSIAKYELEALVGALLVDNK